MTALPAEIEALENEQREITSADESCELSPSSIEQIKADRKRIEEIEHQIAAKFEQWSALEKRELAAQGFSS